MLPRWIPALVIAWMAGAPVAAEDPPAVARVTYVTTSSIYVDAGTAEGLRAGHRLEVVRDGQVVAVLELKDVTTHRASCRVLEKTSDPVVGDAVRFVPAEGPFVPEAGAAASAGKPPGSDSSRPRSRDLGIHGRIGVSYVAISDRTTGTGYSQPALLLQINGSAIAGSPWYVAADLRARRTYRDLSDGTSVEDDGTRLYRLSLSRRGLSDPWAVTIGRQYSPTLAAVNIFDGVSAEYVRPKWGVGLFGGTQPDPEDFGYSEQVTDYGAYATFRGIAPRHGWQVSTAVIGSYDDGELNREYLYLQGNYNGPVFSIYAAEELDFNRGWKKDEGADSVELTGSFVTMRFQAGRKVALLTGLDNRKNVRLWRDHETPVTEFDDAFREGVWAGLFVQPAPRLSFGFDGRTNGGGSAGDSSSYSASFAANGYTRRSLGVNTRATLYSDDRVEGSLYALDFSFGLSPGVYVVLGGGQRDETGASGVPANLTWYGVDVDVTLGRHWYLLIAGERTDGDLEEDQQFYTTLSYQF